MVIHLIVIFEAHWFKQLTLIKNTATGSTASYANRYKVEESYFNQKLRKNLLLSVNWMLEQVGQRLWRSYSWKFSKPDWKRSWATCSNWLCCEQEGCQVISRGVYNLSCSVSTVQKPESSSRVARQSPFIFLTSGDKPTVTLPSPVLLVKGELEGQSWVRLGCGCRSEGTISSCIYETTVCVF